MKFQIKVIPLVVSLFCAMAPGIVMAGLYEGTTAHEKRDYVTALREFRTLAAQGDAIAQTNLGVMYANGQGVPVDKKEAAKWYRLAAEQGESRAQTFLGWIYWNGEGVREDPKEAAKWYRLAAEQGIPQAQFSLGMLYANGEGIPQNQKEAAMWYRLAAEQGVDKTTTIDGETRTMFGLRNNQWVALAQNELGGMYVNGQGVPEDKMEAVKWYRLAAEQGQPHAQINLGDMYQAGQGVPKDDNEAAKWYRLAAEQGNEHAQARLDNLNKKSHPENRPETASGQSVTDTPPIIGYNNQASKALWVVMALIWAIVEGIGAIRKKEIHKRLQSAAIWATVITSLTAVGQMETDQNALIQLSVCLILFGAVAGAFYFIRIKLVVFRQKSETTLCADGIGQSQQAVTMPKIDSDEEPMDDLEELKKRKERLVLERDVARLERNERWAVVTSRWSWLWVGPLGLLGSAMLLIVLAGSSEYGIHPDNILVFFLSIAAITPLAAKFFMKR